MKPIINQNSGDRDVTYLTQKINELIKELEAVKARLAVLEAAP